MAYSTRHWLCTVFGDLFASGSSQTQEHFSLSFRLIGTDAAVEPTQADVDAFITPTTTWFSSTTLGINNVHKMTGIKLAPIDTNGKYPVGEVARVTAVLNVAGGYSATGSWPAQCSVAMSLITGIPRGRAHIGRFYLPPCGAPLGADGTISVANVNNILTPTRTWINAVNALQPDAKVYVASEFGDQHLVSGLRCGRVVDTQRRRRRSMAEAPVTLAL